MLKFALLSSVVVAPDTPLSQTEKSNRHQNRHQTKMNPRRWRFAKR